MIRLTVKEYQELRDNYLTTIGKEGNEALQDAFGVGFVQALNYLWKNHQIETQIITEE